MHPSHLLEAKLCDRLSKPAQTLCLVLRILLLKGILDNLKKHSRTIMALHNLSNNCHQKWHLFTRITAQYDYQFSNLLKLKLIN